MILSQLRVSFFAKIHKNFSIVHDLKLYAHVYASPEMLCVEHVIVSKVKLKVQLLKFFIVFAFKCVRFRCIYIFEPQFKKL